MNVTAIKQRLGIKNALLAKEYILLDKLLDSTKDSAGMDSGDGRVNFKNRSLVEVHASISRLESDIARLEQRLNRTGVMSVSLRRC